MRGRPPLLVYERPQALRGEDGRTLYTVRAYAEAVARGAWIGWLQFDSQTTRLSVRTERETTQVSQDAVAYWAGGLGTQYLRGALARARRLSGETPADAPVFVKAHDIEIPGRDGEVYMPRTYARQEKHGTWVGWIEFHPATRGGAVLRSGNETSQPDRKAVEYWAEGLQPLYFDGAFTRALRGRRRKGG